jgi:hypothetical protein
VNVDALCFNFLFEDIPFIVFVGEVKPDFNVS